MVVKTKKPTKKTTKPQAKKAASQSSTAKKTRAKKTTVKKTTAKKVTTKKTTKKTTAKKATAKKSTVKKAATKKTTAKKAAVKQTAKTTTPKTTAKKTVAKQKTAKPRKAESAPIEQIKSVDTAPVQPVTETEEIMTEENQAVIAENTLTTTTADLAQKIATKAHSTLTDQIPDIDPEAQQHARSNASSIMGIDPYVMDADEEYMNAKQREHFTKILMLWRQSLMEEVDRIVSHMQDESANFPDPNDRATQEEEFSLALRTRDRERKLIRKINHALECIKEDEYGYCESCGVDIGIRRLEARPTATLCIDCKTLDEIRERQMKQ